MGMDAEVKFGDEGFPMKRIPSVSANEVASDTEPTIENRYGRDEADMARFGKRQQLKVSDITKRVERGRAINGSLTSV